MYLWLFSFLITTLTCDSVTKTFRMSLEIVCLMDCLGKECQRASVCVCQEQTFLQYDSNATVTMRLFFCFHFAYTKPWCHPLWTSRMQLLSWRWYLLHVNPRKPWTSQTPKPWIWKISFSDKTTINMLYLVSLILFVSLNNNLNIICHSLQKVLDILDFTVLQLLSLSKWFFIQVSIIHDNNTSQTCTKLCFNNWHFRWTKSKLGLQYLQTYL